NEAIFQRVVETGEPHFAFAKPFEYAEHPERGVTHWDWSLVPIKDSAGTVTGLILTLANVTDRVQAQEALKRSEERYALAQRAANIGSWDWNILTGDLYWSGEIEPMFGFRRGEFGATFEAFLQCVHPEDRQLVMDSVNACVQQGADYAIEHRIVWPDGTTRWVAETGDVFRDQDGQAIRMLGVVRDITARKQAEEALLRRVGELSTLHSIAQTVATVVDLPQTLGTVAEAMTYLFDARATFITVPDAEYMELQILAGFERTSGAFATMTRAFPLAEMPISRQVLDQGQTVVLPDVQTLSLPASVRPYVRDLDLHALILVPLRARGAIVGMLAMGSDQMGRAFDPAEVALVETIAGDVAGAVESTRLAEQARVAAVDAERQRLARELHDSATQSLYSITLFANGWRTMAEQGRLDNVADCFERIGDAGQQALKEMRLLIHQLRPPILEEVGLVGAIQQRLDTVEHRVNVETRLLTQGEVDQLPQAVEEQLFHIAQEALNNALRHAHATTVTVQVCAEDDRFILSVEDDGVGFDPSADTAGMGLVNMRARAAAIGSKVRITSAPQQGTTVEVTLGEPHGR
ncbi:MAG: PAS domain-containing protein, partial [Anaerolineae bacterium]